MESIPDWQLPPGTDRGLWDYVTNSDLAENYDASLAETPLLKVDVEFCERVFTRPGKLIDLGCGTGRLLMHFARKGFDCTGVDLSDAMLKVARTKAENENLAVELIRANLVELDAIPDGSFECAACLFSTLGMILGRENRQRFLKHVRRILKPGGRFVVHVHNRGFQLGTPGGVGWYLRQFGKKLRGSESGDRTMPQRYGGAALTLHHFRRSEIVRDLREAGFEVERIHPVSTRADGRLPAGWLLSNWRAYGYFVVATVSPSGRVVTIVGD